MKRYVEYRYDVEGRQEVKQGDGVERVKREIKEAHPNAKFTLCTEFDGSDGEDVQALLSATAPPGSAQRDDLKGRFGIDMDTGGKDTDIEKVINDPARRMRMNTPVAGSITMISGEPYKKREYCHAIDCIVQRLMDLMHVGNEICKHRCLYTAHDFHDWLQKNGFEIVKKP